MTDPSSNRRNSGRERKSKTVNPTEFSELLAKSRKEETRHTQKDVERLLGKFGATGTVSNWETGKSFPSLVEAQALTSIVKINLMPAWHRVNEQREKEKEERRIQKADSAEPPVPSRISPSEEIVKKLDALPPAVREDIKKRIDEAFKKPREKPAGNPLRRIVEVPIEPVNTEESEASGRAKRASKKRR